MTNQRDAGLTHRHHAILAALREDVPMIVKQFGPVFPDLAPSSIPTTVPYHLQALMRLEYVRVVRTMPRQYYRTPAGAAYLASLSAARREYRAPPRRRPYRLDRTRGVEAARRTTGVNAGLRAT